MSAPHHLAFLDNDHVLGLVSAVLNGPTPQSVQTLTAFFAPERVDLDEVFGWGLGDRRPQVSVKAMPSTYGEIRSPGADTSILVMRRGRVTAELLEQLPRLRLVVRLGARLDGIDAEAAANRGIRVRCVPRRSLEWTAEHALLLMMALGKQLVPADRLVRTGASASSSPLAGPVAVGRESVVGYNWLGLSGLWGLSGRTLGIVGMGEVGALVASRAVALGMRVLHTSGAAGADPARPPQPGIPGEAAPLARVLAEADVASLHVPGTAANRHLVDAGFLAAMRPGACLVNTSRGLLIDEDAAYVALVSGQLAGLGLDVHAREPRPADDPLSLLDTVVMTPHVASGSRTSVLPEVATVMEEIRTFLEEA